MYDKDDMKPGAMKKVAAMKAKNKMSKAMKTGKMLDKKETSDAPRKPFFETMKSSKKTTKTTKVPAFFETMKSSKKAAVKNMMASKKKGNKESGRVKTPAAMPNKSGITTLPAMPGDRRAKTLPTMPGDSTITTLPMKPGESQSSRMRKKKDN